MREAAGSDSGGLLFIGASATCSSGRPARFSAASVAQVARRYLSGDLRLLPRVLPPTAPRWANALSFRGPLAEESAFAFCGCPTLRF